MLGEWQFFLPVVVWFAILGAYLGVIHVTDARSALVSVDRPRLRTGLCAAIGVAVALYLRLELPGALALTAVAASLGYLGMGWARYVDF
jgi:hypothetical protein